MPSLSFSSVSSLRDVTPSRRADERWQTSYAWTRPFTKHTLRFGGDARFDRSASAADANAEGAFVFSGLYASGGSLATRGGGADFADFLLGLPQQATVQYGPGNVVLRGRSFSAYVQDGIILRVNSNPVINPALQVGAVTEEIKVTTSVAMAETHDTSISQVIDQQRIVDRGLVVGVAGAPIIVGQLDRSQGRDRLHRQPGTILRA